MKTETAKNKYKTCREVTKQECWMGSKNCGTCAHCLDTSENGWREGEYFCTVCKVNTTKQ